MRGKSANKNSYGARNDAIKMKSPRSLIRE